MSNLSLEDKIKLIEESKSIADLSSDVLPKAYNDSYYFVSYSHKDYKLVYKDILQLEALGINIWYDNEMHIGENWKDVAKLYISKFQCKGIIFYLTENSITSKACNEEVEYALKHNKKFFSINVPLKDREVESGYEMLLELISRGFKSSHSLIENFSKAFSNEILYLSINDKIDKKANQILSLKADDVLKFAVKDNNLHLTACNDSSLLNVDLSKNYEIDDKIYPLKIIDNDVFSNFIKLEKVELGKDLIEISSGAFRNCISLKGINLENIENSYYIGSQAFYNCNSLEKIDLSRANNIGKEAFKDCINLNVDVINGRIEANAFWGTKIKNIKYISTDPEILDNAFISLRTLEKVEILNSFRNDIGENAFYMCENLKEISKLKTNISYSEYGLDKTKIMANAFSYTGLENVELIGSWNLKEANMAFANCQKLKTITFNTTSLEIAPYFASDDFELVSVIGGENIKEVGQSAFNNDTSLLNINLENVININKDAFSFSGLISVSLPKVITIEDGAFSFCDNLRYVSIGDNLVTLGENAFAGCTNLEILKITSPYFMIRNENAFSMLDNLKIVFVPNSEFFDALLSQIPIEQLTDIYIFKEIIPEDFYISGFTIYESNFKEYILFKRSDTLYQENMLNYFRWDYDSFKQNLNNPFYKYNDKIKKAVGNNCYITLRTCKPSNSYYVNGIALLNNTDVYYITILEENGKEAKISGTEILDIKIKDIKDDSKCFKINDINDLLNKNVSIELEENIYFGKIINLEMKKKGLFGLSKSNDVITIFISCYDGLKAIPVKLIKKINLFNNFKYDKTIYNN